MRYALLRETQGLEDPEMSTGARLVFIGYNVIWWLPLALVLLGVWSYREGAIGFLAITILRALINLYRNNMLSPEAGQRFALRAP